MQTADNRITSPLIIQCSVRMDVDLNHWRMVHMASETGQVCANWRAPRRGLADSKNRDVNFPAVQRASYVFTIKPYAIAMSKNPSRDGPDSITPSSRNQLRASNALHSCHICMSISSWINSYFGFGKEFIGHSPKMSSRIFGKCPSLFLVLLFLNPQCRP